MAKIIKEVTAEISIDIGFNDILCAIKDLTDEENLELAQRIIKFYIYHIKRNSATTRKIRNILIENLNLLGDEQ